MKPLKHKATLAELLAIHADPDAHPNALGYELRRTTHATLQGLAYEDETSPATLRVAAYDELFRRAAAMAQLLADLAERLA